MAYLRTARGRRGAFALAGSVLALALTVGACSAGGGGSSGGGTTQAVSQSDITKAMTTPTHLLFWTWVPNIENEVKLFEAKYPAITVEVVNVGQGADHYKKLRSALQAGQGAPDVAQMEFQYIQSFALGNNLLDLTPYLPASTGNDYVPWVWNQVKSADGKQILGVPQDSGPVGLLYREDVLAKHNIAVPKTWDDFATAAKALHAADPSAYLTDLPGNDPGQLVSLLWQAGVKPFAWDGSKTVTINLVTDQSKKVMQYWNDLIQAGDIAVDPDFTDAWYQGLSNGKYVGWVPAAAWGPVFLQGTAKNTSGLWRAVEMPQWNAGGTATANWGGSSDVVLKSSKNPIAAAMLAYWINHDPSSTIKFANEQFLFPVLKATLSDPAFKDQTSAFYGGQKVNDLFATISTHVDETFGWLPFTDYVYSSAGTTIGKAIADKTDLVKGLQDWQNALVSYAQQQGFTVKTS